MRRNGTAYEHGNSVQMSAEGMAEWHESEVGRPIGPGTWRYSYGGVYTSGTPEKWHRLLNAYTVGEHENDTTGNFHWKIWEWKY